MENTEPIQIFFERIKEYTVLSDEAKRDWESLLQFKVYEKGEYFIRLGQIPKRTAYVSQGLFSQYYVSEIGDHVIKNFFQEGRLAGVIPATLTGKKSPFAIEALEKTMVLEFDFLEFKNLVLKHPCIADVYIQYMEKYWVMEKEPDEISFRNDTAATRYNDFLTKYPRLVKRLKKHQIASYLGVTPTQLSRILFTNK